jgi:hypothetical protein
MAPQSKFGGRHVQRILSSLFQPCKRAGLAQNNGDVMISVVPFEIDVNMGTSIVNASWPRWDRWDPLSYNCNGGTNANYMSYSTCLDHSYYWSHYYWSHAVGSPHSQWNGCVSDRDKSYDVDETAPSLHDHGFCCGPGRILPAAQLLPLTYNWSNVNNTINAMSPNGATNQTVGLQWGLLRCCSRIGSTRPRRLQPAATSTSSSFLPTA